MKLLDILAIESLRYLHLLASNTTNSFSTNLTRFLYLLSN